MSEAQREQALLAARRDAMSLVKVTLHPAYTAIVDRLTLAGHSNRDIKSVMLYVLALELTGIIIALTDNKDMALQIFDTAITGARDALKEYYEETPPT